MLRKFHTIFAAIIFHLGAWLKRDGQRKATIKRKLIFFFYLSPPNVYFIQIKKIFAKFFNSSSDVVRLIWRAMRRAIAMIVASSVRRMVLDPKVTSLHSDYGSFDRPLGAGEGHERDVEAAVDGSSNGMAQSSDVYQRQPLLPGAPTKGKDKWSGVASGSDYYVDDEDEKIDSLGRHPGIPNGSGNGVVKLDIPAPLREEPRFPKEKWKTFLGKDHFFSSPIEIRIFHQIWADCLCTICHLEEEEEEKEDEEEKEGRWLRRSSDVTFYA